MIKQTKPKCNKGTACGYACISGKKQCSERIKARDAAELLKQTGANTKAAKQTALSKAWAPAWDLAPEHIKKAVVSIDQPDEIPPSAGRDAYYSSDGLIHMGVKHSLESSRGQAVYRHEFGHHLDAKLSKQGKLSTEDAWLKMEKALAETGYSDLFSMRSDVEALAKFEKSIGVKVVDGNVIAAVKSLSESPSYYFSSSTDVDKAMREDEADLLERYGKTEADQAAAKKALVGKSKQIGKDLIAKRYKAKGDFVAVARRLESIEAEQDFSVRNYANRLPENGSLEQRIAKTLSEDQVYRIPVNVLSRVLNGTSTFSDLAAVAESAMRADALVDDLAGSLTKNKLGRGHSDEYYAKTGDNTMANTEVFANILALEGSGHPLAKELVQTLAPRTYKKYRDALEALAND